MERTRFIWQGPPTADARGRRLETGEAYAVADFDPDAVAAWVELGSARLEDVKTKRPGTKKPEAEE